MATLKKKQGATSDPQLYQVRVAGNYGGVLADPGALINIVAGAKQEQLIRLRYVEPVDEAELKIAQCGKCGVRFANEYFRERHGNRRHSNRTVNVKDFDQCTQEEKDRILQDTLRYDTSPNEFNVPDPSDREIAALDREAQNNINFEKTAASIR